MFETKNQPFFSIIIPTKGRSGLLADAISSVLHQDFIDYELIVSDNYNDERTKREIDRFKKDANIRYFRTETELDMPKHWEFATTKARGKYVLVLTDRSVLKQHALVTINEALIAQPEISICSWRWSYFNEASGIEFGATTASTMPDVELLTTSSVLQDFVRNSGNYLNALPRGLNSCYRADFAQHIREKHGSLFMSINPDYSSAFLLLAYAPSILHINRPLFLSQGSSVSNGGDAVATTMQRYLDSLNLVDSYKYVPIKAPIVQNAIFSDFIMIRNIAGGNLANMPIDWATYFVLCYSEILQKVNAGIISKLAINQLHSLCDKALESFDKDIRSEVQARLRKLKLLFRLKRSLIGLALVKIKHRLEISRMIRRRLRHATVMAAAGFHSFI